MIVNEELKQELLTMFPDYYNGYITRELKVCTLQTAGILQGMNFVLFVERQIGDEQHSKNYDVISRLTQAINDYERERM